MDTIGAGPGQRREYGYRIDLLVDNCVVLRLERVSALESTHLARLLTCLHFSGCQPGLLVNFNGRRPRAAPRCSRPGGPV